jgi:hypothetical protein
MLKLEDVEQLLEDTKSVVRRHLNDDELASYYDNAVSQSTRTRMEAHLSNCWICKRRLAMMQEILEGSDPLEQLIEAVAQLTAWWQRNFIHPALTEGYGLAAGLTQPQDGQTEDGSLRWRVVENRWGEFIVRFGSHRLEFEGVTLIVKIGGLSKRVTLRKVDDDQVGGRATFTREERLQMPDDAQLIIEVEESNPNGDPQNTA